MTGVSFRVFAVGDDCRGYDDEYHLIYHDDSTNQIIPPSRMKGETKGPKIKVVPRIIASIAATSTIGHHSRHYGG